MTVLMHETESTRPYESRVNVESVCFREAKPFLGWGYGEWLYAADTQDGRTMPCSVKNDERRCAGCRETAKDRGYDPPCNGVECGPLFDALVFS